MFPAAKEKLLMLAIVILCALDLAVRLPTQVCLPFERLQGRHYRDGANNAYSLKRIPHARHVDLISSIIAIKDALSLAAIVDRDHKIIE